MTPDDMHPTDRAQLARDASWCLTSPPLILAPELGFPDMDWFQALRLENPAPAWPAPKDWSRFRLGIQFERLWHCTIEALADHTLVAHNLQVHDGERTLGEFDALVRREDQLEHWEFAVKFYLGTGDLTTPQNWFGPNPQDRLDLKVAHMLQHQMRLGSSLAGQQAALSLCGQNIDLARGIVKGRLFYPLTQNAEYGEETPDTYPNFIHPKHQNGWWLPIAEFSSRFTEQGLRFQSLQKRHWLTPLERSKPEVCLTASQCLQRLEQENEAFAHAIAVIDPAGKELSRGFLVKPTWLKAAGVSA